MFSGVQRLGLADVPVKHLRHSGHYRLFPGHGGRNHHGQHRGKGVDKHRVVGQVIGVRRSFGSVGGLGVGVVLISYYDG